MQRKINTQNKPAFGLFSPHKPNTEPSSMPLYSYNSYTLNTLPSEQNNFQPDYLQLQAHNKYYCCCCRCCCHCQSICSHQNQYKDHKPTNQVATALKKSIQQSKLFLTKIQQLKDITQKLKKGGVKVVQQNQIQGNYRKKIKPPSNFLSNKDKTNSVREEYYLTPVIRKNLKVIKEKLKRDSNKSLRRLKSVNEIFKDAQHKTYKHQKEHLLQTFKLQTKLRDDIIKKIKYHNSNKFVNRSF